MEVIDGDFKANPEQLVLGGGSGEHPAMVVLDPSSAVAHFLAEELPDLSGMEPLDAVKEHRRAAIERHIIWDIDANLEFYEWDIARYSAFFSLCTSHALRNPFDEESNHTVEEWLILGFGEFVFFAMPQLASQLIADVDVPYDQFSHMRYNNIMVVPKNIPVYANGGNAFRFE